MVPHHQEKRSGQSPLTITFRLSINTPPRICSTIKAAAIQRAMLSFSLRASRLSLFLRRPLVLLKICMTGNMRRGSGYLSPPCQRAPTIEHVFYKVDPSKLGSLTHTDASFVPDFKRFPPTRAPYMREPYVRAKLDLDGTTYVDAKAIGWTREHVQLKWQDADFQMHTRWIPAAWVKRITREESSWQDPYDMRD